MNSCSSSLSGMSVISLKQAQSVLDVIDAGLCKEGRPEITPIILIMPILPPFLR